MTRLRMYLLQEHGGKDFPTVQWGGWAARISNKASVKRTDVVTNDHVTFDNIDSGTSEIAGVLTGPHGENIRLGYWAVPEAATKYSLFFRIQPVSARIDMADASRSIRDAALSEQDGQEEPRQRELSATEEGVVLRWIEPISIARWRDKLSVDVQLALPLALWPCIDPFDTTMLVQAERGSLDWQVLRPWPASWFSKVAPAGLSWIAPSRREFVDTHAKRATLGISRALLDALRLDNPPETGSLRPPVVSLRSVVIDTKRGQIVVEGFACRIVKEDASTVDTTTPNPTNTISGEWRMRAEGGFARIYETHDGRGRKIAVKRLTSPNPESVSMLRREFLALRDLHHPNLPAVYDFHEKEGACYFTMQFIEGESFAEHHRHRALARKSVDQLAGAVAALHRANWIHCDVTPHNVRITQGGDVYLLDLGLVTPKGRVPEQPRAGTAEYMSPARLDGDPATPADDWYGVGAVLHEALVGHPPRRPFKPELDPADRARLEELATRWSDKQQRSSVAPAQRLAELKQLLGRALQGEGALQGLAAADADLGLLTAALLIDDAALRPNEDVIRAWQGLSGVPTSLATAMTTWPFLGRRQECEMLVEAFSAVGSSRRAGFVLIVGEPGIGKSELLHHLRRLLPPNTLLLSGACGEREFRPYNALAGAIEMLANHLAKLRDAARPILALPSTGPLVQCFPILQKVPLLANPSAGGAVIDDRAQVAGALRVILTRVAEAQPVVLAIDDLQWADRDSLSLLDELFGADAPPVLLVAASTKPAASIDSDTIRCKAKPLHLAPLRHEDAEQLATQLYEVKTNGEKPDAAAMARLVQVSRHPMFLSWLVRDHIDLQKLGLQATTREDVESVVQAAVPRLGDRDLNMLQLVCWAEAPLPLAALASTLAHGDPEEAARSLRREHWIRFSPASDTALLTPHHNTIRSVVKRMTPPQRLRFIHGDIADILLHRSTTESKIEVDEQDAHAIHHLEQAGRVAEAAEQAESAAKRAFSRHAFGLAVSLYKEAMTLDPTKTALYQRLAEAQERNGQLYDAASTYEKSAESEKGALRLQDQCCAAQLYLMNGHLDDGARVLGAVLGRLGGPASIIPADLELASMRLMFHVRGGRFKYRKRREDQLSPEAMLRIDALTAAAVGLAFVDATAAKMFLYESLVAAYRLGEPRRLSRSFALASAFRATQGGQPGGFFEGMLREADHENGQDLEAYRNVANGFLRLSNSDFVEAERHLHGAERTFAGGFPGAFPVGPVRLGRLFALRRLGRLRDLREARLDALRRADASQDHLLQVTLRRGFRLVVLVYEGPAAARAELASTRWSYPASAIYGLLGAPEPEGGMSYQDWVLRFAEQEIDLFEGAAKESGDDDLEHAAHSSASDIRLNKAELLWLRGRIALARAAAATDVKRSLNTAERAADALPKDGSYAKVWAHLLRAGISACKRDTRTATDRLLDAHKDARALHMELCAAVADLRLARLDPESNERENRWLRYVEEQGIPVERAARLADLVAPGFEGDPTHER
jgi:eukaryotic-like serine/threonine-protein kinase